MQTITTTKYISWSKYVTSNDIYLVVLNVYLHNYIVTNGISNLKIGWVISCLVTPFKDTLLKENKSDGKTSKKT